MRFLVVLGSVAIACGDPSAPPEEPTPQRRVIEPPSGTLRLLPPYVITTEGVGPYKLRQPIAPLLDKLKSGPLTVRIPKVLDSGLSRAEDGGSMLVGTELAIGTRSKMTFLAVVGPKVARMESGIGVGSTRDEVQKQGVMLDDVERAFDPRLLVPAAVRNARLVMVDKRVAAVVLTGETVAPVPVGPRERDSCPRPAATPPVIGACLTGTGELVEIDGDDIVVRFPDAEKPIARVPVPNLKFVVPLRNVADGRDELIAITRTGSEESDQRTWAMVAFRHDNGQLKRAIEPWPYPLYQLTSKETRWIGAELSEIALYFELTSRAEGIEVGGLLTTSRSNRIHDVVTISPVTVPRKHHKPATTEGLDAGVPAEPPDAAVDRTGSGNR